MKTGPLRYFAIRNGDFIEFRAASKPPRAKISKLSKVISEQQVSHYTVMERYPYSKPVMKTVERLVVLKQTFFIGGRFLFSRKLKTWTSVRGRLHTPIINNGKLVEIGPDIKDYFRTQTTF